VSGLLITAAWWLLGAGLCALLAALLRDSTEGALPRYLRARRYHRAGLARHTVRAIEAASVSALETVPDPAVSPFAARAV
jgi:hypothetical protein